MPRGTKRGKIAAIGWQKISYAEVTQGMGLSVYANPAAFEADWTFHPGMGGFPASFGVANIFTDGIQFSWNGGEGDAYYEKTIAGLMAGTSYDMLVTVSKASGFDFTGDHVMEVDHAGGTTELGGGVPMAQQVTVRCRVTASALGSVTVRIGNWEHNIVLNGLTTIRTIEFRELDGVESAKQLLFRLDAALAWSAPKEGSRNRRSEYGLGALYELPGVDYFLRGSARRIPQLGGVMDDGETITGWDEDGGWQDFLVAARDKQLLTFYPDVSDLGTSVSCYLVEPLQGPPDHDGPGYYQLPIKLVSSSPFDGY